MNHGGNPIFCMDAHPLEPLVATGGGDGTVKVWNVESLYDEESETPKLQAVIKLTDNVNCIRWSPSGSYLACGCDDSSVIIFKLAEIFDGGEFLNNVLVFRKYDILCTLRGHTESVTDLSWNNDNKQLITSSLDHRAIIWNIETGCQVTILQHTSSVLGVSWDPIGELIVSQDNEGATLWTIVMVGAVTSSRKYVASLTFRDVKNTLAFQGHKNEVVCSRYSPYFYRCVNSENKKRAFQCFVIGGLDNSLSVWVSRKQNRNCIQDITWLPGGMRMMACSVDGFVAFFEFTDEEIGGTVSDLDYVDKMRDKMRKTLHQEVVIPTSRPKRSEQSTLSSKNGVLSLEKPKKRIQPQLIGDVVSSSGISEAKQHEKHLEEKNKAAEKIQEMKKNKERKSLSESKTKSSVEKETSLISDTNASVIDHFDNTSVIDQRKRLTEGIDEPPPKKTNIFADRSTGDRATITLKCVRSFDDKVMWTTIIPFKLLSLVVSDNTILILTEHLLSLYSPSSGIVTTPPLFISNQLHKVFLNTHVFTIDVEGMLTVYDKSLKQITKCNVLPLIQSFNNKEITKCYYFNNTISCIINDMHFSFENDTFLLTSTPKMQNSKSSIEKKSSLEICIVGQLRFGLLQDFESIVNDYLNCCAHSKDTDRLKEIIKLFNKQAQIQTSESHRNKFVELSKRARKAYDSLKQ
ncbi:Protein HIRA [Entamoeba marina]